MALVKTKKKIEGGWSYRGFEVIKLDSVNWSIKLITDEIEVNENIQLFLDNTHKQLKKSCETIDGLYEGIPYTSAKSIKVKESENKMKDSWDKFYRDSRSKKCKDLFKVIYPSLKGLHYGEYKENVDAKGNISFYWLPMVTDFEVYKSYPAWNMDILEEFKEELKDDVIIDASIGSAIDIKVIMNEKQLSDYFLDTTTV